MLRLFVGSWSSCLRMYSQSFLVSSVRGSGSFPTTAVSAASGCTGLLRAFLGAAAFLGVGIGQLERGGLGCQAKNVPPRSSKKTSRPSVSVTKAGLGDASYLQANQRLRTLLLSSPAWAVVHENLHSLIQLFNLQWLLQNRDRADLENPIEDLTIRVT